MSYRAFSLQVQNAMCRKKTFARIASSRYSTVGFFGSCLSSCSKERWFYIKVMFQGEELIYIVILASRTAILWVCFIDSWNRGSLPDSISFKKDSSFLPLSWPQPQLRLVVFIGSFDRILCRWRVWFISYPYWESSGTNSWPSGHFMLIKLEVKVKFFELNRRWLDTTELFLSL